MPDCAILYHYYYPDDVVSSRHFTDFAESLAANSWNVRVFTSNRYCRKEGKINQNFEVHNKVVIRRFGHLSFFKTKNIGRILNSFFLGVQWFFVLLFLSTDVVVFGTDPQFCFFMIPLLALFRPKMRFVLWGFDLYPEAIIADGIKMPQLLVRLLKWWAGVSYRCCELLVDIGSCMRRRFCEYNPEAQHITIIPWAIDEPEKIEAPNDGFRWELFGAASIGILYSGTIGRAHQFEEFILLARELRRRNASVSFCFAGQGNKYKDLQNMVTPDDTNITFAGFVDEKFLSLKLAAADIHMISLREGWEGVVVPSKFFGSLAAGRPLLYCGTPNSCIVELIKNENIGFIIENNNINDVCDRIEELSKNKSSLSYMQEKVFSFYKNNYSKNSQCMKWEEALRKII